MGDEQQFRHDRARKVGLRRGALECKTRESGGRRGRGGGGNQTHRLLGETDPEFALERADQELGFLAFALCQQGLYDADFATLTLLLGGDGRVGW